MNWRCFFLGHNDLSTDRCKRCGLETWRYEKTYGYDEWEKMKEEGEDNKK